MSSRKSGNLLLKLHRIQFCDCAVSSNGHCNPEKMASLRWNKQNIYINYVSPEDAFFIIRTFSAKHET